MYHPYCSREGPACQHTRSWPALASIRHEGLPEAADVGASSGATVHLVLPRHGLGNKDQAQMPIPGPPPGLHGPNLRRA